MGGIIRTSVILITLRIMMTCIFLLHIIFSLVFIIHGKTYLIKLKNSGLTRGPSKVGLPAVGNKESLCDDGSDICDDPMNYPKEEIENALALQKNEMSSMFSKLFDNPDNINSSINDEDYQDSKRSACDSSTQYNLPRVAINQKGNQRWIVNGNLGGFNAIRRIRVVYCVANRTPCTFKHPTRKTECRQQHSTIPMVAYDQQTKKLVIDNIDIPTACACYVGPSFNINK